MTPDDLDDLEIVRAAIRHYIADVGGSFALGVAREQCEVRRSSSRGVRVRLAEPNGQTIAIYVVRCARGAVAFFPRRAEGANG